MRILVSCESFGYGPVATGLCVCKKLKKYDDVKLDFIGSGIAYEQAKMSGYFDKFYLCDTFDFDDLDKHKKVIQSYDIFLSSENLNGAIYALKSNIKKTYYIDNLMWMWDKVDDGLINARKYFISDIIPSKENFNKIGKKIKNPVFVGPIREIKAEKCKTKNQLMINIGGAESFMLDKKLILEFYNKIINEILEVKEVDKFESIIICGGSGIISKLCIKNNPKIKKETLSHDDYIKEMKKSEYLIMASGLGNFIESVGKEKNIMYIPAINYSQLQQIEYYEKEKLGFDIINWPQFDFYKEIPKFLEEEEGVNLVVSNIKEYLRKDYSELIKNKIKYFLNNNQKQYFKIRKEFINKFDKNASSTVAKIIYEDNKEG